MMKDLKFDNQRGASMACDLVDVVRCKDCLFSTCETYYAGHVVCVSDKGWPRWVKENGFCDLGEMKG